MELKPEKSLLKSGRLHYSEQPDLYEVLTCETDS